MLLKKLAAETLQILLHIESIANYIIVTEARCTIF